MPDLPEPSVLLPAIATPRRVFRMYVALPDDGIFQLSDKHDAQAFGLGSFEIGSWYRLLAKIAHGGAFYDPGDWTKLWEPLLPELILGTRQDYDEYVGGTAVQEFQASDGSAPIFYRTVAVEEDMVLVSYFRLFNENETPTYQVVVGRRRDLRTVTTDALQDIHPQGLSALAVDLAKVRAYLEGLDRSGGERQSHDPE